MRLRNKKTGEIGWLYCDHISVPKKMTVFSEDENLSAPHWDYTSLAELNEEWEDVPEESQEDGLDHIITLVEAYSSVDEEYYPKEIVEKLKAWRRLKDLGAEILGWEIRDMPSGGNWQTVNVKLNVKARKEPMSLLDLLFGGEE